MEQIIFFFISFLFGVFQIQHKDAIVRCLKFCDSDAYLLEFDFEIIIDISFHLPKLELEFDYFFAHNYKGLNQSCQRLLRDRNYRCPHVLLPRLNGCKRLHSSVGFLVHKRRYYILVVRVEQC